MASNIDLNINIGANVTDLQAQLQKAENLLKQFEAALKKATNVGEINYLNGQIKNLNTTIASLGQQMNKVGRPAVDATNALGNLSRVAQDAPFGFMAISNNLNPLLESFQRLQVESKNTGTSLTKNLVASLTGPAGVGLALGVVSSLIVAYGKDINNFIDKTLNGTNAINEHTNALKAGEKAYMEAYTEMYKLGQAFNDYNNGLINKKEVLKQYNNTLGDTYGKTNDVAEAEKIWAANSENFVKGAILRAAALSQIEKAAEKAAKAFEEQAKPKEKFTSPFAFTGAGTGGAAAINLQQQTDRDRLVNQRKIVDGLKEEEKFHLKVAQSIEDELKNLESKAVYSQFIGKELPKETKEREKQVDYGKQLVNEMQMAQFASKRFMDNMKAIGLEIVKLSGYTQSEENEIEKLNDESTKYYKKKLADLSEQSNKTGFGALMMNRFKKDKEEIDADEERQKRLKNLNKKYTEFAKNISTNVTGALFGMYDAMQQGLSVGEALGQMFSRLARSIAESLVQAALFAGILSLISGGASNAANGGVSFFGAFKSVLGLASGGIATGPTLAMIGEGSESEAVLPLSKLGGMLDRTFTAGAMNGNVMGQGGQFVLKGNDLVLALQRSNSSLNLRRGV